MSEIKTCSKGHAHDATWEQCPYCDESLVLPTEAERPVIPITLVGWIVVLNGHNSGRDFRIEEGSTLIGKGDDCDIILDGEYISSHHARIEAVARSDAWTYVLTDLGSTNGTLLGDSDDSIDHVEILSGAEIVFGSTQVKFVSFR